MRPTFRMGPRGGGLVASVVEPAAESVPEPELKPEAAVQPRERLRFTRPIEADRRPLSAEPRERDPLLETLGRTVEALVGKLP